MGTRQPLEGSSGSVANKLTWDVNAAGLARKKIAPHSNPAAGELPLNSREALFS